MKNLGLVPVRNFGILDHKKGLYRSAQPMYGYEYEWLKNVLGIKTIVNLRAESNHDGNVAVKHGINVINFLVEDHKIPNEGQIKLFMDTIKDDSHYPLLFHCEHGHGRTSTFCVLARLAMGWTLDEALNEEREKFHYQFKYKVQIDFLESLVDKNLVVTK
jgi:protein tyrosine/serine phosphatase